MFGTIDLDITIKFVEIFLVFTIHVKTCDICHYSKKHKLPFPHSTTAFDSCFDLIHVDIWGYIFILSIHEHKYFLIVVDDFSRHT